MSTLQSNDAAYLYYSRKLGPEKGQKPPAAEARGADRIPLQTCNDGKKGEVQPRSIESDLRPEEKNLRK